MRLQRGEEVDAPPQNRLCPHTNFSNLSPTIIHIFHHEDVQGPVSMNQKGYYIFFVAF